MHESSCKEFFNNEIDRNATWIETNGAKFIYESFTSRTCEDNPQTVKYLV